MADEKPYAVIDEEDRPWLRYRTYTAAMHAADEMNRLSLVYQPHDPTLWRAREVRS